MHNEYVRNSELYTCHQFWHFPAFPLNTQDKNLPKRLYNILKHFSCGDSHAGQYHFGTFGQNFKAFNLSVSYLWRPCLVPLSVCSLGTFATWRLSSAWGGQDLVKSLKSCRHFMKIRCNFSPESCLFSYFDPCGSSGLRVFGSRFWVLGFSDFCISWKCNVLFILFCLAWDSFVSIFRLCMKVPISRQCANTWAGLQYISISWWKNRLQRPKLGREQ